MLEDDTLARGTVRSNLSANLPSSTLKSWPLISSPHFFSSTSTVSRAGVSIGRNPNFWYTPLILSIAHCRFCISAGKKSRIPLGAVKSMGLTLHAGVYPLFQVFLGGRAHAVCYHLAVLEKQ